MKYEHWLALVVNVVYWFGMGYIAWKRTDLPRYVLPVVVRMFALRKKRKPCILDATAQMKRLIKEATRCKRTRYVSTM